MNIKYDEPFEVNKTQYDKIMYHLAGVVAGREEDGKYFIKLWVTKYKNIIEQIILK